MDESPEGLCKTLFHGNNGTKIIPKGIWMKSSKKDWVTDGSSSTKYLSGWHVFETLYEANNYLYSGFQSLGNKIIVSCNIRGDIRRKSHSRANVWLSDEIFLKKVVYRHKNCLTG